MLLESIPIFGDIRDPRLGVLYEGDVKGGIFPTVSGYPKVVINGGSKKKNTKRKKCIKRKKRSKKR